ncbi:Origin recognition complex subunit 3, partial [Coemansia erecta]
MAETYKPMDAFDSMTESTFIIKPKQKAATTPKSTPKQKTKQKTRPSSTTLALNADSDVTADGGYVTLLQGREPAESMQLRKQLFRSLWQPLEEQLFAIEKQVNNIGVTEVCDFVDSSYGQIESREHGQVARPFAEVSAAVAFAGVNTGDHDKLFRSLQDQLVERGHHVALLESQYCSTVPNLHKSLLEQMFGSLYADAETGSAAFGGAKTVPYDLGLLKLWWADTGSSGKKAVVILQDFEGFAPM